MLVSTIYAQDPSFTEEVYEDRTELHWTGGPLTIEKPDGKRVKVRIPLSLPYLAGVIIKGLRHSSVIIEGYGYVKMWENSVNAGEIFCGPKQGTMVVF
jgi:hypothetical protein